MIRIVRGLRAEGGIVVPEDFYLLPEGERGYLFLERAAKVRAFLRGRDHITLSDVAVLALPILNHRIGFQYAPRDTQGVITARQLISQAVQRVVEDGARGL
jgi:MoxR-like ATPase